MKAIVKLHCGNAHTKGNAKKYYYYICSLFRKHKTLKGYYIYKNSKISTVPRRSSKLSIEDGIFLAKKYHCKMIEEFGSIHNHKI